ncbi:isocitrate lyase/PEP mutase family protein [Undibacterium pigrum]|uniref:2-methylisocitrate lyase-like PEP mutase family enzyme n=1 Tax=Undibacterium pigrum TaxID=401470 RepID=A0A318JUQ3_9BURK|nr:isocitrate lyase/phosphoenolpyruvate mutase family protein [Undibacterium pigrum]PXX44208.1 2-methylisocitrate lyase-like PEP mutase family enzyme [Undibacterium pigrum]
MQHQIKLALQFRRLNQQGQFMLANAWDIASARIFAKAGFPALGTTSGGIAYAQGFCDAELIGRDSMMTQIAAIARSVDMPVNADIEAGYGAAPEAVAETIRQVIAAGAVGVNLEDNSHGSSSEPLFAVDAQCARIAAARQAADQAGLPLWINARTDTFLLGLGEGIETRIAMSIQRGRAYLAAGADMVFIPALADLTIIALLAQAIKGPINIMAMPGAPVAQDLFQAGASRVSLGVCPMLAVMGTVRDIAEEARKTGSWQNMERSFYGFAEAEELFA